MASPYDDLVSVSVTAQTAALIIQWQADTALKLSNQQIKHDDNWTATSILETIKLAALLAAAVIQADALIDLYDAQYELAEEQARIAKEKKNDFFGAGRFADLEKKMVYTVYPTLPNKPADYAGLGSAAAGYASSAFHTADVRFGQLANKYRLCVDPSLVHDVSLTQAIITDDTVNFAYRHAEDRSIRDEELWWNRRFNVMNLGKDLAAISATYAQTAAQLYGGLTQMASQGLQGTMGALGYMLNRNTTTYPVATRTPQPYAMGPNDGPQMEIPPAGDYGEATPWSPDYGAY